MGAQLSALFIARVLQAPPAHCSVATVVGGGGRGDSMGTARWATAVSGTELREGWGRKGVLGGKWPFPGGEGALWESIRSGATRLGAGGLRGGSREPWEEDWGCRDVPACPLHGETSKERKAKRKGKGKHC